MSSPAAPRGSLYILFAALLLGTLWSGGYFNVPKWTLLVLLLAAAAWELAVQLTRGRHLFPRSPALMLLGAFTTFAAASSLWSVSPSDSMREALLLMAYLGVLVVVRGQLARDRRNLATISIWFVYVAVFVSAWGIGSYIYHLSPYTIFLDNVYRAGSTFEYSNGLSCFALMALPVACALMGESDRRDRPFFAAAISILTAASVLAFSRLGMVLLMGITVYMVVSLWRRGLALMLLVSIIAGVITAALAVELADAGMEPAALVAAAVMTALVWLVARFMPEIHGTGQVASFAAAALAGGAAAAALVKLSDRAESILNQRVWQGFTLSRLLPHRLETFDGAVDAFRVHPLAGSGLGSFAEVYRQHTVATYTKFAHNLVLQTAVDTGLIGATLFTAFLAYVIVLGIVRLMARNGSLTRAFAVASLTFIVYNMVDWEWYIPSLAVWFMVALAIVEAGADNTADGAEA